MAEILPLFKILQKIFLNIQEPFQPYDAILRYLSYVITKFHIKISIPRIYF